MVLALIVEQVVGVVALVVVMLVGPLLVVAILRPQPRPKVMMAVEMLRQAQGLVVVAQLPQELMVAVALVAREARVALVALVQHLQ